MIRRYCYCKYCGNKTYNLTEICFPTYPPKYSTEYYCEKCNKTDYLKIEETYLEDTDDIKEENNYTTLDILNEIKEYVKLIDYGEPYTNRYALQINNIIHPVDKETYNKWDRWLNYDNTK